MLSYRDQQYNTFAMIDSGATNSFLNSAFLKTTAIPTVLKDIPLDIQVIDGRPISSGAITHHSVPITMAISGHEEKISLDITSLGDYPVILGLPWLSQHNPQVNWTRQSIVFSSPHCLAQCIGSVKPEGNSGGLQHSDNLSSPNASGTHLNHQQKPVRFESSRLVPAQPVQQTLAPRKVSLVSAAAFHSALQTASVYGITTPPEPSSNLINPQSAEGDDDPSPTLSSLQQTIPQEFHDFLEVFKKSNSDKLPDHGPFDHAIPTEGDSHPPFGPIYSLSEVELKALDDYLKENLKKGFIRPSSSPAGAPILFVKKSDGSLRLCVDYRGLNRITRKNRYPLPLIQESLDRLKEASWFTKIDLRAAYNLIRISSGDEWKTAFRTRYGLFEYLVMPFGLTNAPASFQHLINSVLRDYLDIHVIVYLDDILIFSKTREEHVNHVKQVLQRLQSNQLWAKAEKCTFFKHEVDFLGYIVSDKGISMDPKKVDAVSDWPAPKSVHDIQVFLGFANFYRRFIKAYSKVASPLTRLLRKEVKFVWGDSESAAFNTLKEAFTSAPILQHFQPSKSIIIESDASDYAIAGVLSHPGNNNQLHPVAYYSRKLQPAELNYEIYDKEMLAIVEAFKHWRAYLEGASQISVFTDHKNLEYFTSSKVLNRRQARWAELLAHFDFKITYRPGTSMGKPDALTRRQHLQGGSRAAEAPPHTLLKPGQFIIGALHPNTAATIKSNIMERIQQLQPEDPTLQELLPLLHDPVIPQAPELSKRLEMFSLHDNLVYYNNLIYIPDDSNLKMDLLQQVHNSSTAGHLGQAKTHDLLTRHFYFPGLRAFVNTYVAGCHTCTRNKVPRHKPFGPLQSLPIPASPWQSLSMDAIIELPPSKGYDSIMVFVDRFTKQAHFVPYLAKGFDAPELAIMFRQNIMRLHGIPRDIISDRGSIFNSQFWRAFVNGLGIKPNFSTAFHPQSDGQTERVNQVLEQYLRTYCNYNQTDWSTLLDLAEFSYNNAVHASTKYSPFEANYGYHPQDPSTIPLPSSSMVPAASQHLERLSHIQKDLATNIEKAQASHAKYYNRKIKEITGSIDQQPVFKVGDMVFLNRKNIKTHRPALKLDNRMLGPFKIIEATPSPLAFKLDLPPTMAVHPAFHVSLLEPLCSGHPNQPQDPPPKIQVDGVQTYIIERILDSRISADSGYDYLVHWQHFSEAHNSWEPWEEVWETSAYKSFYRQHRSDPSQHFPPTSAHNSANSSQLAQQSKRSRQSTSRLRGLRP